MPKAIPYPRIASRLYNTALLLRPDKAELISSILAERLGLEASISVQQAAVAPKAEMFFDDDEGDGGPSGAERLPYTVVNGTALIPVTGELVNRGSWIDAVSGLTAYKSVSSALAHAAGNDDVTGILLDIDSPGGEASGCMELGAFVRQISNIKPVTAFVDGEACSAAYAIACGAPQIIVTPSATLGSIGVVLLHIDRSVQMEKQGLKPTLIQKGKYKTDGTALKPLSQDAMSRLDGYLDVLYGLFVSTVATHRASLSEESVRNTEAGLFIGQDAIAIGLADKVGTLDDAFATLPRSQQATGATLPVFGGVDMPPEAAPLNPPAVAGSNIPEPGTAAAPAASTAPTPAPAALVPPAPAPAPAAPSASAERTRIAAIIGHAEAKGREDLAQHFAFHTDMSPEAAAAALAKAAKSGSQPAAGATGLVAEMSALTAPDLGSPAADAAAVQAASNAGKTKEQLEFEEGARTAARHLGKKIS